VKRVLSALDGFWFVEGSATRLALLRIVIGLGVLHYLVRRFAIFTDIAASPAAVFEPVGLAALLSGPIPPRLFHVILVCTLIANVAFILGWRFGRTGPVFAGLLLWVLCYRNSWSMLYHTDNLVVWHVLILGLTRSADALSLDAVGWSLARALRRGTGREDAPSVGPKPASSWRQPRWHWEYGYPVMLLCAVAAVIYVLSGVAKVTGPAGWAWALGDDLRSQVAFDGLRKELIANGASTLAFVLYNNVPLATLLGTGTLVIELGAPLALLDVRLGRIWAVGAFAMHWGIYAIMGIVFWYQMSGLAFVPFLVDERVAAWSLATAERLAGALGSRARQARAWWSRGEAPGHGREVAPGGVAGATTATPLPDPG